MTVPVEVELPEALVEAARGRYELARLQDKDPDFADFLADVIMFSPTYTVDGVEIDMETGQVSESGGSPDSGGISHSREEGDK